MSKTYSLPISGDLVLRSEADTGANSTLDLNGKTLGDIAIARLSFDYFRSSTTVRHFPIGCTVMAESAGFEVQGAFLKVRVSNRVRVSTPRDVH